MKRFKYFGLAVVLLFLNIVGFSQLKLGYSPSSIQKSSILELESSNQGLLFPRIGDTSLINVLNPQNGTVIYFTPTQQLLVRSNGYWQPLTTPGSFIAGAGINYNATTGVISNAGVLSVNGNTGALTLDTNYIANFSQKARSLFSGTAPITYSNGLIGITQATTSTNGYLSSADWNTFNNKANSFSTGNLSETGSAILTITGGTGAVVGSGTSIQVKQASRLQNGFLSSADWNTFNNKLSSVDTSDISNFYLKVRSQLSAGVGITYDNSSGVITNSGVISLNGNTGALTMDTNYISNFYSKVRNLTSATGPINYNPATGVISMPQAGPTTDGYLSSSDWNIVNNKLSSIDTSDISNFYLKVRSELSAGTGISYNNNTGIISNSGVTSLNGNTGALTMDTNYISNFYSKVRGLHSGITPITYDSSTGAIGITKAGISASGYLDSTDWKIFNNKISRAGDTMSGFLILNADPVVPLGAVTKQYVDELASGIKYIDAIATPDLENDNLNTPPIPVSHESYIIGPSPTGAWSGLAGHVVYWNGSAWVDILNRPVQTGDRFGVLLHGSAGPAGGGLTGKEKNVVEIVNATPGSITYTFTAPTFGMTVFDSQAPNDGDYGSGYNYDGTNWNQFISSIGYVAGNGLTLSGNSFSIGLGQVTNNMLQGSITSSKLIGTDIGIVGTITSGTWNGTPVGDNWISSASAWNSKLSSVSNLAGTGIPIYKTTSANDAKFKRLVAGPGMTITDNTDSITISSTGLTSIDTTNISNFYLKVRKELSAGTGITYNNSTGVITNSGVTSLNGNTGALTLDTNYISNFSTKIRSLFAGTTPITYSNGLIGISQASSATNGYLSSADWNTFNSKVASQWITSGNNIYYNSGNVGVGTSTFDNVNPERFLVDAGATGNNDFQNVIVGKANTNSYAQLNIQNLSSGTNASSDVVATADNGSETTNFVDMGINSSGNTSGIMGGAGDAYLYNVGGNFLIGPTGSSNSLVILTGGQTQSTNERMRIDSAGRVGIGITNPSAFLHLISGTAAAKSAPLKFTAGTNLVTTEGGAVEFNGSHLYFTATDGGTRYQLDQQPVDTSNISNFSDKVRSLFSGTTPITYSNGLIGISQATTSTNGYLSSADWNTFNSKQGSGNYMLDPGGNGIVARTALNTTINRTITGTANRITLTNGDGVSGNPTIDVGSNIVDKTAATTYTAGRKQTFVNSATTAGFNLTASADPSTPASGDFWNSNTTANSLKYRDASSTTRTLVDLSLSQTLTNKTISGASNTITNIPNSALSNNSITVATGTSGTDVGVTGSPVSLGGTVTLNIPIASATNTGKLSSADWIAFNNKLSSIDTTNLSGFSVKVRSLFSGTAPITYANGLIGISQATTSADGYLSSTDWNTFNNKLSSIDTTSISSFSTKVRSLFSGTAPITYSNGLIGISQSTTSTNGYLSSTDWNTFNNKLSSIDTTNIASFSAKVRSLFSGTAPITYSNGLIGISQATTSTNGYLSSADWNTFNNKGSGSVSSVSVVTANGVSGTVATATTTPAITLTLGAITPASVAATGTVTGSNLSGTNTGNVTIGTANGLSIAGQALSLGLASTSTTGALSNTDWNTFNNKLSSIDTTNISGFSTKVRSLFSGTAPITYSNGLIGISQASTSTNGYLSSADWNTFNNKLSSIDTTNVSNFSAKVRSLFSGTAPITYSNGLIGISQASTSTNGYLSSADWNTFNSKGSGSVTSVSVITANGVSGTVATATTTPAITLTLGAITPSSVAATGTVTGSNLSGTNTGNVTIGTANGLSIAGQALSLGVASTSTTGALGSTDWNTFNNKLSSIDTTNISNFSVKVRSLFSNSAPITYANGLIGISQATTSTNGYLSSTDWNTFNNKAGNSNVWLLSGNSGITPVTNFIGTTDNKSLRFRSNNTERMIIDSLGRIGIGVSNPGNPLVVRDTMEIRRVGSVSELLFSNTAGTGDFRIGGDGGDIFWQGGGARNLQMGSYWTTVLAGDRQTATFPSYLSGTGNTGVLIPAQRDASVPLAIQANSTTQTANLTEWRNSSGTVLDVVDQNGNMGIGSTAFDGTNPEKLLVDAGTTSSFNVISGTGSINNYLQLNIQNNSAGASASSDVVATADNGTESVNFVDLGINSSGYSTSGILGGVNNGYLYSTGNDFVIGNATSGKNLLFFTGGTSTTNERMRITGTGNVGINSTSPSSTLEIAGSMGNSITTTTTNLTLDATNYTVIITGSTPTITLPAATSCARRTYIIVNETGLARTISSYINFSAASVTTVAANSSIKVQSNGTSWYRIQ